MEQAEQDAAQVTRTSVRERSSPSGQGKGVVGKVVIQDRASYKMGWKSVAATKLGIATTDEKVMVTSERQGLRELQRCYMGVGAQLQVG
jgi:hypothetical protein